MTLTAHSLLATDWLDQPVVTVPGQQSLLPVVYPPARAGVCVGDSKAALERAQEYARDMIRAALGADQ